MEKSIYDTLLKNRAMGNKSLAVLIDPEKCYNRNFAAVIAALKVAHPPFVFIGGSHAVRSLDSMIDILRDEVSSQILLFPGDVSQFTPKADAVLYLSLLSGRNPDFLIAHHMVSALAIRESGMEVIPTGYLLIEGGKVSSVEYISNTRPIPRDKKEIALSTALAGELLGLKLIYLEAGSGALYPVPADMIALLRDKLNIPIVVGGGITTIEQMKTAFDAGADLIVIGNFFEQNLDKMPSFCHWIREYNESINVH